MSQTAILSPSVIPPVTMSMRKPKITMISANMPSTALYACSEKEATAVLNSIGFPVKLRQIQAAMNPKIHEQKYIRRVDAQSGAISLHGCTWHITRLAGSHRDRLAGSSGGRAVSPELWTELSTTTKY